MSYDRYKKIRAALEMGPTPGPWNVEECRYGFAVYASKTGDAVVKTEDVEGRYGAIDNEADARLIVACDPGTIRELLDERDALAAEVERLRRGPHPAITHCDRCGCDWIDNGLNPVGCPYCKLGRETERELKEWIERGRTEEETAAALKWLNDMRGDSKCRAGEENTHET